jgi:hypothetical protein
LARVRRQECLRDRKELSPTGKTNSPLAKRRGENISYEKFLSVRLHGATFILDFGKIGAVPLQSIFFSNPLRRCFRTWVALVALRFLMLFVSGSAVWLLAMIGLQDRWPPGDPPARGRRKMFKGVAMGVGFLIFVSTWYLIVALDPSLR